MLWLVASVCMEPRQCWHWLALVAYSLKPVKLLGPCKRTQHCWPTTPNKVGYCWHLLRPFAWAFNPLRFSQYRIDFVSVAKVTVNCLSVLYTWNAFSRTFIVSFQTWNSALSKVRCQYKKLDFVPQKTVGVHSAIKNATTCVSARNSIRVLRSLV